MLSVVHQPVHSSLMRLVMQAGCGFVQGANYDRFLGSTPTLHHGNPQHIALATSTSAAMTVNMLASSLQPWSQPKPSHTNDKCYGKCEAEVCVAIEPEGQMQGLLTV